MAYVNDIFVPFVKQALIHEAGVPWTDIEYGGRRQRLSKVARIWRALAAGV